MNVHLGIVEEWNERRDMQMIEMWKKVFLNERGS